MTALLVIAIGTVFDFPQEAVKKQLKAEIVSKTIRTRDCGQIVTVKQTDQKFQIQCQQNLLALFLKFFIYVKNVKIKEKFQGHG